MFDTIHEECGVFGIYNPQGASVAQESYQALYALQHRGQESCGIAVCDRGVIKSHKDLGLVCEVFDEESLSALGEGQAAVGHVRYSTTGAPVRANAQPLVMRYIKGTVAIAHNGNLTNAEELRSGLARDGAVFQTTNDSEMIAFIIAKERVHAHSIEKAVLAAMNKIKGAYSLVVMSPRKLIAARDPQGFKPLCMGELDGGVVFASESCVFETIGAQFIRDVRPGEVIVVDENGIHSHTGYCGEPHALCVFEYIYFARPDSVIEGLSVHRARREAGKLLTQEHPVTADIVAGVPDSGIDAALGFSEQSGIPFAMAFVKNRYIGRTFIQPSQRQRERSVKIKLSALVSAVKGKRVVLIDDSIVRGTTSARIVSMLREAGATEVHMRISAPPFLHPCYFGTDIDSPENLIATKMPVPEIGRYIGADSLGFLSINNLKTIADLSGCTCCYGCFSGEYPIAVPSGKRKSDFEASE